MTQIKEARTDRPVDPDPELWRAILDKVEEITTDHPEDRRSMRGTASVNRDGTMSCIYKMDRKNGEDWVYLLEAFRDRFRPDRVTVKVERYLDSHENYWTEQLADRAKAVVVDGIHYRIGRGNSGGFGGRKFVIKDLASGEIVETHGLWYQGPIPPMFREQLPDTAEFVPQGAFS